MTTTIDYLASTCPEGCVVTILFLICVALAVTGFGYALLVIAKRADADLERMRAWDHDEDDRW